MKPSVLELYCGAGLATRGLFAAGAREVAGVDLHFQPRFPESQVFLQGDMQDPETQNIVRLLADEVDFIWASPPCQFATALRHAPNAKEHKNLIPMTRDLLLKTGKPFVIENVEEAAPHLHDPVMLCGSMFGLGTYLDGRWFYLERHRLFECHGFKPRQPKCQHDRMCACIGVYGSHARVRAASAGGRGTAWPFTKPQALAAAQALGVEGEGFTLAEMSQGIPPAYSAHILRSWRRQTKDAKPRLRVVQ